MDNPTSFTAIIKKALFILKKPASFYREMPKSGGFLEPVIFVIVMAVIVGLIMTLFSLFGLGIMGGMAFGFNTILFTTIASVISSFIGAAILFVIWKLMGSDENYQVAYRCIAFAAVTYPAVALLAPIPFIGSIASIIIGTYFMVIASIQVHGIKPRTAYLIFGILGFIGLLSNISNEIAVRNLMSQSGDLSEQFKGFGEPMRAPNKLESE